MMVYIENRKSTIVIFVTLSLESIKLTISDGQGVWRESYHSKNTMTAQHMLRDTKEKWKRIVQPDIRHLHASTTLYLTPELTWQTLTMKEYSIKLREFWRQHTHYLMTTRFNESTYRQNRSFCERNAANLKCVYCCPHPVLAKIPVERIMFVLEMNNDANRIEGIGLVRNRAYIRRYAVYENMNYNRHVYVGKQRIDRREMTRAEEGVMQWLDLVCFKGTHHMKRGQGMTSFPTEWLFHLSNVMNVIAFLREMFKDRMPKNV